MLNKAANKQKRRWRIWWPRTLGAQLIVVTAAAVLLSNFGVAIWFENSRERLTETSRTEHVLDRIAAVATVMSRIPDSSREETARAMSSGPWQFRLRHGAITHPIMNDEEKALAARVREFLTAANLKEPVQVHIRAVDERPNHRHRRSRPGRVFSIAVPIEPGVQLVTTYFWRQSRRWPAEIFIAGLVAILTASAAAAYIARRVARPLSELASAASEAALGGPAPRVPEEGPDDVRRAAHAFNAMTDQIQRTMESQRQLLSAVGHDLRTPITAMRINIEFVDDAELRERLERNLEELQELTEAVLSAARGTGGEKMRKVDLAALIESLCADLEDMEKPVTWVLHDAAPLSCRPNELRRAIRNLIENAVAYGKTASVQLKDTDEAYEIIVEDEGPGIADADRMRVFEPFVRLETSRSTETGGTGLGLTLVKSIAEGHGGEIILENRDSGGLRATLRLPRGGASA